MSRIAALVPLFIPLALPAVSPQDPGETSPKVTWMTDVTAAEAAATKADKPLLLVFR